MTFFKGNGHRSTLTASPFRSAATGEYHPRRGATMADVRPGWQGGIQSSFYLLFNPLTENVEHRDPPAATNMAVRGAVATRAGAKHPSLRLLDRNISGPQSRGGSRSASVL